MTKPNKSIAYDINHLMASDPLRFAQLMNSGLCLDTINQPGQSGGVGQTSPSRPPFANYSACSPLDDLFLGGMGNALYPTIYDCRYDRERARQYALQWGSSDAYKDATPGMRIVAAGATDCTNFASQVLAAGGFRPTEHWYYTRTEDTEQIGTKSTSWAGTNYLLGWLTGKYGTFVSPDMTPLAQTIRVDQVDFKDVDSVVTAAQQANGLISPGDLIFYEYPHGVWDHVAIVIGWGSPYNFESNHIWPVAPSDRVPWIVDHGASDYPNQGRIRPYNYHDGYLDEQVTIPVTVYFVHIPDSFVLNNITNGGRWDW